MFELPCGVRLRAFRPSASSSSATSNTSIISDIDNIIGIYNDPTLAPLVTQRLLVPRGGKLKDEFQKAIDNDAEMFCIIESMPVSSSSTSSPAPAPTGQSPARRVAWDHDTPRFVGFTALWAGAERAHRHSSFSLVLLPEAHGKGVGTAVTRFMLDHAFVHLNTHRISLSAFEGNDIALTVYRKCGFIDEGRLRKAYWVGGQWKDYINMGILIEDWIEKEQVAGAPVRST
ncbi:hypothetical protein HYPSUDRAFT_44924 [Hypholoma sublateritium FD-334 SS-4]|uniref:N-acetyltransferase domain-containing protein n=1 Tax=Hypholoma sublateritium (strain FD-334 SS-4) TaxID=945553 RepID=A0A0D2PF01_HYPSF|nr:hypothetical protein HYPSUDRAFT_44924 [Hypholoma sublateritium FD-334 SS-4]